MTVKREPMQKSGKLTLASVVITAGILAGCSGGGGGDDDAKKDDQTEETTPATKPTDPGDKKPTYTDVKDPQGSVEGYEGAMEDAKVDTCSNDSGKLEVAGSVSNPTGEPKQYRIYVSAMAKQDTRGIAQIDVPTLDPGETTKWDTTLDLSDDGLKCLLRVERFDPVD